MRNATSHLSGYGELSSLLSICGREKRHRFGSSVHAAIIKNTNRFGFNNLTDPRNVFVVWNSLIAMYSKCGRLQEAAKVFDDMPLKDTISWNSIISGCFIWEQFSKGFEYFKRMLILKKCWYDQATLTSIISICTNPELLYACSMIHSLIISSGYGSVVQVGNALISGYFRCCSPLSAKNVFDSMVERNVITWTAMVSGLAQCQLFNESLLFFREIMRIEDANSMTYTSSLFACSGMRLLREGQQIHGCVEKSGFMSDLHVKSALMDMYSKCGMIEDTIQVFHSCVNPDEVFSTVMLVGFAQNGMEERAFEMFSELVRKSFEIDENMVSAVLGGFGSASTPFALALGKQIHSLVIKKCFFFNVYVCNGLINMYSKCGELKDSIELFNLMPYKNSVSWNSMIAAFGRHGYGTDALQLYEEMLLNSIEPTDVTFLSLLHACSHVGSVEKGVELLRSMISRHGITPRVEHYVCIVDMLGRAGQLYEARSLIEELNVESSGLLWQAFIGACGIHGNLEMGRYAAEKLVMITPDCTSAYVLLSNIYSAEGRWEDRARIIRKMKEKGVKKEIGVSWIELGKKFHSFVVDDDLHPHSESIYGVLSELIALIRDEENMLDERLILNELEIQGNNTLILSH
ncbi:pentatricopeptide repeat-containing protein At3g05340 [Phalaenopsis equestris]|uniref:pentatricopeptide repeat-containing protein At3g05340 n=1 Tax=Phalaenopsis equestris TaxID=78828 RepID=UPI0009E27625|nr:pentatricopeptide repeat-containing protein At3g05340 [Phalaenopsis equestris]